jgi:hypothetical protein
LTLVFGAKGAREVKTFLERKVDLKDIKWTELNKNLPTF